MLSNKILNVLSKALLVTLFCVLSGTSFAAAKRTITFTNNTGQDANDLHIEFKQAATNTDSGAFGNVQGDSTSKHDYDGGAVANGASTTLKFSTTSSRLTINRWWWTLDGQRIGSIQSEQAFASAHIEQENAKPGDLITVAISVFAKVFEALDIVVNWTLTNPQGDVIAAGSQPMHAPPGHQVDMQVWTGPVDEIGIYHLQYDAIAASGEVSIGEGDLVVDEGMRPIAVDEDEAQPVQF
ncbi:hypothetical protein KIH87_16985 [Paraneptunicella aestuarii]|uniref:hypothetical protein n=1 Tax=Paraneptunicella aestuarii TaxID=2831148 RepID=UPI001E2F4EDA|nr:hypothetical protein [Paraneptunicella aestuarii]UAA38360.1 hypothetical protein KIH87_16985 [Paraneptunicella aestuarii]